jgi:hypothetical protein
MPTTDTDPRKRRLGSLQWWIRDDHDRVVLAQAPNAAIIVWFLALIVRWTSVLDDQRTEVVKGIGRGALVVWGLDELVRGASPARRLLGGLVLVATLVAALH